jgi:hypothetical protein
MLDIRLLFCTLTFLLVGQGAIADHQDKFYLRSGQALTGKLENPYILFDTAYGQFKMPNAACRTIDGIQQNLATFNSINHEVITGLIRRNIKVQRPDRSHVSIKKESILKIVCTAREKKEVPKADYFHMLDGDRFYGTILDQSFLFTTTYGEFDTKWVDVSKIVIARGQTQMLLSNGNLIKGYISSPFIMIKSLYDFDMKIPNTSIKLIQRHAVQSQLIDQ